MTGHGIGVPLRLGVLPRGDGCLGYKGANARIIGSVRQHRELFVGHVQLVAERAQALSDLEESALDE